MYMHMYAICQSPEEEENPLIIKTSQRRQVNSSWACSVTVHMTLTSPRELRDVLFPLRNRIFIIELNPLPCNNKTSALGFTKPVVTEAS